MTMKQSNHDTFYFVSYLPFFTYSHRECVESPVCEQHVCMCLCSILPLGLPRTACGWVSCAKSRTNAVCSCTESVSKTAPNTHGKLRPLLTRFYCLNVNHKKESLTLVSLLIRNRLKNCLTQQKLKLNEESRKSPVAVYLQGWHRAGPTLRERTDCL